MIRVPFYVDKRTTTDFDSQLASIQGTRDGAAASLLLVVCSARPTNRVSDLPAAQLAADHKMLET